MRLRFKTFRCGIDLRKSWNLTPYAFTMSDNHNENTTPMCFLDLPRELRDMIYECSLVNTKAIDLTSWNDDYEPRVRFSYRKSGRNKARTANPRTSLSTNILRTCHQIYSEGIEILYGKNSFRLVHNSEEPGLFSSYESPHPSFRHFHRLTVLLRGDFSSIIFHSPWSFIKHLTNLKMLKIVIASTMCITSEEQVYLPFIKDYIRHIVEEAPAQCKLEWTWANLDEDERNWVNAELAGPICSQASRGPAVEDFNNERLGELAAKCTIRYCPGSPSSWEHRWEFIDDFGDFLLILIRTCS